MNAQVFLKQIRRRRVLPPHLFDACRLSEGYPVRYGGRNWRRWRLKPAAMKAKTTKTTNITSTNINNVWKIKVASQMRFGSVVGRTFIEKESLGWKFAEPFGGGQFGSNAKKQCHRQSISQSIPKQVSETNPENHQESCVPDVWKHSNSL